MPSELRDLWRAGLAGATELGARFGPVVRRAGVLLGAAALALLAVRSQCQGDRSALWAASQSLLWQQAVPRRFKHADVNPAPLLQDAR